jgi:NAD(P)-dependent dehydrogenase (short-subunit alcohol dehydrogenase family)
VTGTPQRTAGPGLFELTGHVALVTGGNSGIGLGMASGLAQCGAVGTSSVSTIHGAARGQAYGASKAGLTAMIKACAVELARYGINAHSIVAGWTETPMASPALHSEGFERNVMKRMPHRRWGEPGDFARLAVYLAAGIGGFHTGDEIVVDGGYSIF